MTKQARSIAAFLMAWMFVFSMLSTCYCAPAYATEERSVQQANAHCKHHPTTQENDKDCSPRYQTDNFEVSSQKGQLVQLAKPELLSNQISLSEMQPVYSFSETHTIHADYASPPIYIIFRSILI
jgi:hypothetical protein